MSSEGSWARPASLRRDRGTASDLLAAIAAGDHEAFEAVYTEHSPRLYGLACRMCGPSLGGDVVVEAFVALWTEPQRFRSVSRSLFRLLLAETRDRAVQALRNERGSSKRCGVVPLVMSPGSVPLVHPEVVERVAGPHLSERFDVLSDEQRDILVLAYFGGYTCAELTTLTGRTGTTIVGQINGALRALRDASPSR